MKGLICVKLTTPYLSPETPIQWLPSLLLAGRVSEPREALDVLEAKGGKSGKVKLDPEHIEGQSKALSPVQDVPCPSTPGNRSKHRRPPGMGVGLQHYSLGALQAPQYFRICVDFYFSVSFTVMRLRLFQNASRTLGWRR